MSPRLKDIAVVATVGLVLIPTVALLSMLSMRGLGLATTLILQVVAVAAGFAGWAWLRRGKKPRERWMHRVWLAGLIAGTLASSLLALLGWRLLYAPEFVVEAPFSAPTTGDRPASITLRPDAPPPAIPPLHLELTDVATRPEFSVTAEVEAFGTIIAHYRLIPVITHDGDAQPPVVRYWLACPTSSSIKCLETSTRRFEGAVSAEPISAARWADAHDRADARAQRLGNPIAVDPDGLVLFPMEGATGWWRKLWLITWGALAASWAMWALLCGWWRLQARKKR